MPMPMWSSTRFCFHLFQPFDRRTGRQVCNCLYLALFVSHVRFVVVGAAVFGSCSLCFIFLCAPLVSRRFCSLFWRCRCCHRARVRCSMPCFFAWMLLVGWLCVYEPLYTIAIVVIRARCVRSSSSYFWWWWWCVVVVHKSHTPASECRVRFIEVVTNQSNAKAVNHPIHTCV